jgi:hypothetical protein
MKLMIFLSMKNTDSYQGFIAVPRQRNFVYCTLTFLCIRKGWWKFSETRTIVFELRFQVTAERYYTYDQISGSQGCRITRALESWVMSLVTCWFPLNASKLMSVHHSCLNAFIEDRCSNSVILKNKKKGQFSRIRVVFVIFFK